MKLPNEGLRQAAQSITSETEHQVHCGMPSQEVLSEPSNNARTQSDDCDLAAQLIVAKQHAICIKASSLREFFSDA